MQRLRQRMNERLGQLPGAAALRGRHPPDIQHEADVLLARKEAVEVGIVGHVGRHALCVDRIGAHAAPVDGD